METDFALTVYCIVGVIVLLVSSIIRLVYDSRVLDALIVMSAINSVVLLLWLN